MRKLLVTVYKELPLSFRNKTHKTRHICARHLHRGDVALRERNGSHYCWETVHDWQLVHN